VNLSTSDFLQKIEVFIVIAVRTSDTTTVKLTANLDGLIFFNFFFSPKHISEGGSLAVITDEGREASTQVSPLQGPSLPFQTSRLTLSNVAKK
jgi:hypothetical protein